MKKKLFTIITAAILCLMLLLSGCMTKKDVNEVSQENEEAAEANENDEQDKEADAKNVKEAIVEEAEEAEKAEETEEQSEHVLFSKELRNLMKKQEQCFRIVRMNSSM